MFKYDIITPYNIKINKKIIDKIFIIIKKEIDITQEWVLNIIFTSKNEIKKLNNTYRWIDKETDVLSFHYYDDFKNKKDQIVWELVFCEEKIKLQWKEYKLWEEYEFYKLLIHSILHILWYDHEDDKDYENMQKKENTIWEKLFEKNK